MDLPGRTLLGVFLVWSTRHMRSTTRRRRRFLVDYGQLVLACALAMSAAEHPIITLMDTPAGARIVSYLPMNGATYSGTLSLDLRAENGGLMTVDVRATFPGQLFDWFRGRTDCRQCVCCAPGSAPSSLDHPHCRGSGSIFGGRHFRDPCADTCAQEASGNPLGCRTV
jgi:hypothetical protein